MSSKRLKRPRDPVRLAKLIGDIATGQRKDEASQPKKSDNMKKPVRRTSSKKG